MERSIERRVLVFLFLLAHVGSGWSEETQSPGDKAFNTTCFACHTIGGDRASFRSASRRLSSTTMSISIPTSPTPLI